MHTHKHSPHTNTHAQTINKPKGSVVNKKAKHSKCNTANATQHMQHNTCNTANATQRMQHRSCNTRMQHIRCIAANARQQVQHSRCTTANATQRMQHNPCQIRTWSPDRNTATLHQNPRPLIKTLAYRPTAPRPLKVCICKPWATKKDRLESQWQQRHTILNSNVAKLVKLNQFFSFNDAHEQACYSKRVKLQKS